MNFDNGRRGSIGLPTEPSARIGQRSEYRPFPNVSGRNARQARFEVPLLVSLLGVPKGKRMLEVGCGRGIALGPLQQLCRPIYLAGLDIDPALLATAEKGIQVGKGRVELIAGDVRNLPFEDASFDVVIDFGTCYHISEPERALAEIARVLAVGGLFVYETRLSQLIAHPVRSFGRSLPWHAAPNLQPDRNARMWASRVKVAHGSW